MHVQFAFVRKHPDITGSIAIPLITVSQDKTMITGKHAFLCHRTTLKISFHRDHFLSIPSLNGAVPAVGREAHSLCSEEKQGLLSRTEAEASRFSAYGWLNAYPRKDTTVYPSQLEAIETKSSSPSRQR